MSRIRRIILERKCPSCQRTLKYKTYKSWWSCKDRNTLCLTCARIEKNGFRGKHHSEETRDKISKLMIGRTISDETKRKLSEAGRKRKHTDEEKRKISEARIVYMKQHPTKFISASATKFLDVLEKLFGVKFEREYELGGRLFDGRNENLLVEVDSAYFHNLERVRKVDILKNTIAKDNDYKLVRFNIDNMKEVHDFAEYHGFKEL